MATIKQIAAMSAVERDAANQQQLARLTNVPIDTAFYDQYLKNWSVKLCGPKPSLEAVKLNHAIDGGRRNGVETMWLCMTMRPDGATVGEYMRATSAGGAAHNNAAKYNTERNGAAWFVRVPLPNGDRAGRWQHVITDKGIAQLDKRIAALTGTVEAKAVKPAAVVAGKAKVKAAKKAVSEAKVELTAAVNAKPAETPLSEAPAADVPQGETSLPATPEALATLAAHFSK